METVDTVVLILFKSAFILLTMLFVNRFLKYDYDLINRVEEASGRAADWLKAHHLSIKSNLYALASLVALALFVNWYAELDNELLNSAGDELRGLARGESWNNIIPLLDSITKLSVYMLMVIALNRFFKADIDIITRIDNWLYDFLDRLILSHGGVYELVMKTVMTLVVAMTVNYHAQIGFVPLTWLQGKTIAALGLEGLGEGSAARRHKRHCQRQAEILKMRLGLMTNAMLKAESEGRPDAAVSFRNKMDAIIEEARECGADVSLEF